ncbi:probable inactive receptor kinase At3g08680 isoform X2 [Henckelia pumila]|uniref:probable inactive receptor kinase At3g08680 isoform X2 n=1 Tax=Henckelia pumila TaxID=405737 RepID=UPI003C6DBD96
MSRTYDNWERLVAAVLKKEQLWQLFHQQSRSTSFCSDASDLSSSFDLSSPIHDVPFDLSWPGASSPHRKLFEDAVAKLRLLPKLIFISDFSLDFVLEDVLRASSKLLGRGTFGSVYAASMDNGISIAVKRLKLLSILEQDFKKHMEIVGEIRHENVVPLRAYLSSKDEKLMLYDYYYKGSVSALLHDRGLSPVLLGLFLLLNGAHLCCTSCNSVPLSTSPLSSSRLSGILIVSTSSHVACFLILPAH